MIDGITLSIAVTALAGVVWSIRQEGRINNLYTIDELREKQSVERHAEIIKRLERMERKQDAANGKH